MAELTVIQPQTGTGACTGRALLDGAQCRTGDRVRASDLVLANFDKTDVHTSGALYLLQSTNGWRGCRYLTRVFNGIAIDQDGWGDWITTPSMGSTVWRVVATVENGIPAGRMRQ